MKRRRGLSLVELILAIAIFAVLSTVVIRLFLMGRGFNERARALDHSVAITTRIMETIQRDGTPFSDPLLTSVEAAYPIVVYLDDAFSAVPGRDRAHFRLTLAQEKDVNTGYSLYKAVVVQLDDSAERGIYELEMQMP